MNGYTILTKLTIIKYSNYYVSAKTRCTLIKTQRDNNKEELPIRKSFQHLENETNTEGTGLDKYARKTTPNVSLPKPNNNEVRK